MLGENSGVDREAMMGRHDMILKREAMLFKDTDFVDEDGTAEASKSASRAQADTSNTSSSPTQTKKRGKGRKGGGASSHNNASHKGLMPPIFMSMPRRDVLHKLIVKASEFETLKDLEEKLSD